MPVSVENRPELKQFRKTWLGKPQEQVVEELASYSQETKRIPDAYIFVEDGEGDLYSPTAKCKIKTVVKRDTLVGKLEGQAVDQINDWFKKSDEGATVWISPPDQTFYPTSKIIISEIRQQGGKKILFNRAILLDMCEEDCLKLAQDLDSYSKNRPLLSSINEVRANPLIFNTYWKYILEEHLDLPTVWEMIRSGYDIESKKVALDEAGIIYPMLMRGEMKVGEMEASGFVGGFDSSCPTLMGSDVFTENAVILGECKKIKCQRCPWEANNDEVKRIQKKELTCCPKCGWKPGNS